MICDNCEIELERRAYCSPKCKMAHRRKLLRKVTESIDNAVVLPRVTVTKRYKSGCRLHGSKSCRLGTCQVHKAKA